MAVEMVRNGNGARLRYKIFAYVSEIFKILLFYAKTFRQFFI